MFFAVDIIDSSLCKRRGSDFLTVMHQPDRLVTPKTKHGNFTESRKTKNMHKILVFLRFISYFSIVWNILKDILILI